MTVTQSTPPKRDRSIPASTTANPGPGGISARPSGINSRVFSTEPTLTTVTDKTAPASAHPESEKQRILLWQPRWDIPSLMGIPLPISLSGGNWRFSLVCVECAEVGCRCGYGRRGGGRATTDARSPAQHPCRDHAMGGTLRTGREPLHDHDGGFGGAARAGERHEVWKPPI